jgi:hypothetical protein
MKANELRIGNLVSLPGVEIEYCEVLELGKIRANISGGSFRYHAFLPIPLTEEWLVRFGFEKLWYDDNGLKLPYYRFNDPEYVFDLDYEFCYTREDGGYIRVKSIHQLQNLYFAMTGEELEL